MEAEAAVVANRTTQFTRDVRVYDCSKQNKLKGVDNGFTLLSTASRPNLTAVWTLLDEFGQLAEPTLVAAEVYLWTHRS
jgi:hypothetical protein